jgi:hypothetical protein
MWWASNASKVSLLRTADALKVGLNEAGGLTYESWGKELSLSDFSEYPVIKVRARFEGSSRPTLRVALKDVNSYEANLNPPSMKLKEGNYQDYYFNFKNKWKQGWPDAKTVDSTAIKEISLFINPGTESWTGTIYIDEIKAVKVEDIPEQYDESISVVSPDTLAVKDTLADIVQIPENSAPQLIDDFKYEIYTWWVGSDKIKLLKEGEMLKVELKDVGPAYENWGRTFNAIDFNKTPVLKIRMKAEGTEPGLLRVDIKDSHGFASNARPVFVNFKSDEGFTDYYFDFTGKFEQSRPDLKGLNPAEITGLLFYINPGGELYSGILIIDDISLVSPEDYKNRK